MDFFLFGCDQVRINIRIQIAVRIHCFHIPQGILGDFRGNNTQFLINFNSLRRTVSVKVRRQWLVCVGYKGLQPIFPYLRPHLSQLNEHLGLSVSSLSKASAGIDVLDVVQQLDRRVILDLILVLLNRGITNGVVLILSRDILEVQNLFGFLKQVSGNYHLEQRRLFTSPVGSRHLHLSPALGTHEVGQRLLKDGIFLNAIEESLSLYIQFGLTVIGVRGKRILHHAKQTD